MNRITYTGKNLGNLIDFFGEGWMLETIRSIREYHHNFIKGDESVAVYLNSTVIKNKDGSFSVINSNMMRS